MIKKHRELIGLISCVCTVVILATLVGIFTGDGNNSTGAGQSIEKDLATLRSQRNKYLDDLCKTIYASVQRNDKNYPEEDHPEGYAIFHGCYDWHSAVLGYWALLRAARYTGNKKYTDFVVKNLDPAGLEKEKKELDKDKTFEMPYGRACILLLALEYEQVTGSKRMRPIADDCARSLVDYYSTKAPQPLPNNLPSWLVDYYNGKEIVPGETDYFSAEWAFRNMLDYGVATGNKALVRFVQSKKDRFLADTKKINLANDKTDDTQFFSAFGNYFYLLEELVDDNTFKAELKEHAPAPADLRPIMKFLFEHQLALNYSRARGFWSIYKKTGDPAYARAYLENVMAGYREHAEYRKKYGPYSHWVPQLGVYALTVIN